MMEEIMEKIYEALNWQGGTIHQVVNEIKKLQRNQLTYKINEVSYSVVKAYNECQTQGEALEKILDKYSGIDMNIIIAMWYAIDAYCDIME